MVWIECLNLLPKPVLLCCRMILCTTMFMTFKRLIGMWSTNYNSRGECSCLEVVHSLYTAYVVLETPWLTSLSSKCFHVLRWSWCENFLRRALSWRIRPLTTQIRWSQGLNHTSRSTAASVPSNSHRRSHSERKLNAVTPMAIGCNIR